MATKNDKFSIQQLNDGSNRKLICVNILYEGDRKAISVQDLLEFLKQNNLDPKKVPVSDTFMTAV